MPNDNISIAGTVKVLPVKDLKGYEKNPRKNDNAVEAVANSIREFGFKVPVIVDKDNVIVAGHTRIKAAKQLGLTEVPVIVADDLTPEQVKAFRLADNKVAGLAGWDWDMLAAEMDAITDIDMGLFSFDAIPTSEEIESFFEPIPSSQDGEGTPAPNTAPGEPDAPRGEAPARQVERVSSVDSGEASYLRITCPHCGETIVLNDGA